MDIMAEKKCKYVQYEESQNPWETSESDFPEMGRPAEKLRFMLNYAVLAPSIYNIQPWIFKILDNEAYMYADMRRKLPIADPDHRQILISCGVALFNIKCAIEHFRYTYKMELCPSTTSPDLLATISLGNKSGQYYYRDNLFHAIKLRRTKSLRFKDQKIPDILLDNLKEVACLHNTWFQVVHLNDKDNVITDLIVQAKSDLSKNRDFCNELASWLRSHNSSLDGLSSRTKGYSPLVSVLIPLLARNFKLGNSITTKNQDHILNTSTLAVLGTQDDTPLEWLHAGMSLQNILLHATTVGLSYSFVNDPIVVPELRKKLSEVLNREGYPQIFLRFGYSPDIEPTPRRPVGDVLI